MSMIGSCSRNDQAVLMACLHSPNYRVNMIHRLEEWLDLGGKRYAISSQDYQRHAERECGYRHQTRFSFEDYPQWHYLVDGVEIVRTIALMHGNNTVGVTYEIRNRSNREARLSVRPHLQFVPKGTRLSQKQEFTLSYETINAKTTGKILSNNRRLSFRTNASLSKLPPKFCDTLYYADDVKDGKMELGRTMVNHELSLQAPPGEMVVLEMVYGVDVVLPDMGQILESIKSYRDDWRKRSGFQDETALALCAAASQFISYRASTTKQTILAGFPFFEDWGRDTMIALVGCCLSTKRFQMAEDILRTFMLYCRKGLMPNLFPEGKDAPGYNTVDASLLFIIAVYEYYLRTKDAMFVESAYPVMAEIIQWYEAGTDYGIHMDEDGLLLAGAGLDQVTWMDVRVGDILPTPRHGKPVEVNAYWYNALRVMEFFQKTHAADRKDYGAMAKRAHQSFLEKFWNEEAGCLKDVVTQEASAKGGMCPDGQIRCNQIWAVSLPFSLLPRDMEQKVVETVFQKLYTPYGLRTLDPEDEEYRPFYGGAQLDRDLAYHQGTVWTYPLGGYYLAYLKVHDDSEEAVAYVKGQLSDIEAALREGCVGQLAEIYDGEDQSASKGCFAQAWSVGEILRVYERLEEHLKIF